MRQVVLAVILVTAGCATRPLGLEDTPPVVGANDLSPVSFDLSAPSDGGLFSDGGVATDGGDNGTGLFVSTLHSLSLPSGYLPRSVAIGDVTGDGRNDIVVGAVADGSNYNLAVIVFAQTAAGTLAAPAVYPAGSGGYETPAMLSIADLDGDGRLDVALTAYNDLRVLTQTFAGTLGAPRTLTPSRTDDAELLATGDFDGDGRADVLAAAWSTTGVDVWYQAEALGTVHNFGCPHGGGDSIAVADLDGDGALDVAISSENSSTVCLALQRAGGFAAAVTVPLTESPPPEELAAGDVDGDGRPDLLLLAGLHIAGKYLDVLHQNQDGTFTLSASLDTEYWPSGLQLADVDGDGRLDAVVSHFDQLVVGIYRQLPGGGLAAEETYPYATSELNGTGPERTAVGDINGDGKPDIVSVATSVFLLYHR